MKKLLFTLGLLCLVGLATLSAQREYISEYDVTVEVQTDRSVTVTEKITVHAQGEQIRRGITRLLLTERKEVLPGLTATQSYDIVSVKKDGREEPYNVRSQGNGDMIYVGDKDIFLDPGVYTYEIVYTSPNQISLLEELDEITWNAIGLENTLAVDRASCTVVLPAGANILQQAAYTGYYGQQGEDFTTDATFSNEVTFTTTKPLDRGEGLTVSVGFPKGVVKQPGMLANWGSLLAVIMGGFGFLFYGVTSWRKYGIDPPKPAVYPIFTPPRDLSASSLAYLKSAHVSHKSFSSAIISLATQGYLTIELEEKKGFFKNSKEYFLRPTGKVPRQGTVAQEEIKLFDILFQHREEVHIKNKYNKHIESSYKVLKNAVDGEHSAFHWEGRNLKRVIPLVLIVIATAVVAFLTAGMAGASAYAFPTAIGFVVVGVIGIILYIYLINQPTPEKLQLQSEIEGFKMYLAMAEKDRINLLNPPEMTVAHFEEMLPYVFALGLENKWSKKFATILEAAQYRPDWNNNHVYFSSNNFSDNFQSALSTSSTPPSSSGGSSGGGGFSGGGGGGGGVGGW